MFTPSEHHQTSRSWKNLPSSLEFMLFFCSFHLSKSFFMRVLLILQRNCEPFISSNRRFSFCRKVVYFMDDGHRAPHQASDYPPNLVGELCYVHRDRDCDGVLDGRRPCLRHPHYQPDSRAHGRKRGSSGLCARE